MAKLDLVEENREQALIHTTAHNQLVTKYYNKRFQPRTFKVGDLVLKKVMIQKPELGSFGPKWEGQFSVISIVRSGTYRLPTKTGWFLDTLGAPTTSSIFTNSYPIS